MTRLTKSNPTVCRMREGRPTVCQEQRHNLAPNLFMVTGPPTLGERRSCVVYVPAKRRERSGKLSQTRWTTESQRPSNGHVHWRSQPARRWPEGAEVCSSPPMRATWTGSWLHVPSRVLTRFV